MCAGGQDFSEHDNSGAALNVEYVDVGDALDAAMRFLGDETSYFTTVSSSETLDVQYHVTLLLHVYPESNGTILNFGTESGLGLSIVPDGDSHKLVFQVKPRDGSATMTAEFTQIEIETRSYIAATYDYSTGQATVFVNNVAGTTVTFDTPVELHTSENLIMGGLTDSWFLGDVSCVRVYDRALTMAEISENEACPIGKSDFDEHSLNLHNNPLRTSNSTFRH